MIHGWRGKIGFMHPSTGLDAEMEFHRLAPEGVAILFTRLPIASMAPDQADVMNSYVELCATIFGQAKVDLIVYCCTGGSFMKGFGYDQELINRIEKKVGIEATTTSTAVVDALKTLGVKKVAVATPYKDDINEKEKEFLEVSGFKVTRIKGLGISDPGEIPYVRSGDMYRLAREVFTEEADAAFISCTGIGVMDIIEPMEVDLQRPVITSNQVTFWQALRKINVREKNNAPGKLFRL